MPESITSKSGRTIKSPETNKNSVLSTVAEILPSINKHPGLRHQWVIRKGKKKDLKEMPQLAMLGGQIFFVVWIFAVLHGHSLFNRDTGRLYGSHFARVVGHQLDGFDV